MPAHIIDDLGIVAHGNAWMSWRYAKNPTTGAEVALAAMSKGGFLTFDPRTRQTIHVRNAMPHTECWAVGQSPQGPVFAALYGSGEILRWDWSGEEARVVAKASGASPFFTLDIAPDGRVYLPNYSTNHLLRYDPAADRLEDCGDFNACGEHLRHVCCGSDGLVYVTCNSYARGASICVFDPATGTKTTVGSANASALSWQTGSILRDATGRVLVPFSHLGRTFFHELRGGQVHPIAQNLIRLTPGNLQLVFSDGSYLDVPNREEVFDDHNHATLIHADGRAEAIDIPRPEFPLRIFSVENGAGRIWCGTFIPLRLASYDPATGKSVHLGNPTHATGEIYNMAFSHGKLYMASYTSAPIARYIPDQPWRKDDGIHANPAHLGLMKETGAPLQRPHGRALDPAGRVFFSARGDYGCFDSGVCRIDPDTDQLTRWIYPDTTMQALTYLRGSSQLLVAERRRNEKSIRFTFISPENGEVASSEPVIEDNGEIFSWLDATDDGGDLVYGLHAYRATVFAFSISKKKIVAELRELRFGEHCHNALMFGPDRRIWGLTNEAVWAVTPDLQHAEEVANYRGVAYKNSYRFGMCTGPDGAIYFPNGTHLMRIRKA